MQVSGFSFSDCKLPTNHSSSKPRNSGVAVHTNLADHFLLQIRCNMQGQRRPDKDVLEWLKGSSRHNPLGTSHFYDFCVCGIGRIGNQLILFFPLEFIIHPL